MVSESAENPPALITDADAFLFITMSSPTKNHLPAQQAAQQFCFALRDAREETIVNIARQRIRERRLTVDIIIYFFMNHDWFWQQQ